jgi:hypothetical protein
MSHSRNNNIIESDDSDLDPSGYQLETVIAPEAKPVKLPESIVRAPIGFNTVTLTLTSNQPQKLFGADPARTRALVNVSSNVDVLVGDASTVSGGQGFNMTNHNSGGAIELTTSEEVWVTYKDTIGANNTVTLWAWIERAVSQ